MTDVHFSGGKVRGGDQVAHHHLLARVERVR